MAQPQLHVPAQPASKPFEVRVDGAKHGAFGALRDAMDAARIKKRERPAAVVGVTDASTGQFVYEAAN